MLDSRQRGRRFEPHRHHCFVSLSINPSLVLVQPRKTRSYINERLLMGRKESNQTNKHYLCEDGIEKSVPIDHLVIPNSDPWDRFFYPSLTLVMDMARQNYHVGGKY